MKKYILIYDKKNAVRNVPLAGSLEIGRKSDAGSPRISLDSAIASRTHGELAAEGNRYRYRDLGSTNGTYINGNLYGIHASDPGKSKLMEDGDVLRIDCPKGHLPHEEAVLMLYCENYDESEPWGTVKLPKPDEVCELRDIPVRLFQNHGRLSLEPLKAEYRVSLNQEPVSGPVYLYPLDVIRFSGMGMKVSAIYTGAGFLVHKDCVPASGETEEAVAEKAVPKDAGSGLRIRIRERCVRRGMKKQAILRDIDMDVFEGEMVLILGGSGAGKTTFMNAVMGYEKADGNIYYGGTDLYEEYERMKYRIGFVPQKDLLRPSDTVYDTLLNAAQMKLPKTVTPTQQKERIENVLTKLGLKREQESLVSKLSGGQRKRLSIAVEFISDPSLFFLDEPDSGLDGIMARSLMENLRAIADDNKIVMVITHAPDRTADLFDKVLVLAKSTQDNCGHMAYYGPVGGAYEYFGTRSLEGIVKKINRLDEGGEGMSDFYIENSCRQEGI